MELVTAIIALIGAGLFIASAFFRTPDHPQWSWNPKNWVPMWKLKKYFRPPGYWMMIIGFEMFCLGTLVITFVYGWDFR